MRSPLSSSYTPSCVASRARARASRGFTMVETIMVVALIAIVMAVGFVALWNLRISLLRTELDTTARELYVAAQNHLSAAYEQGMLTYKKDGKYVYSRGVEADADGDVCFFYKEADASVDPGSVLGLMLPVGSIDEGVRTGESYIISYQPSSGKVLNVFCAKSNGYRAYSFGEDDYATLTSTNNSYTGADNAGNRDRYADGTIGWFGGDGLEETPKPMAVPSVRVSNGDTLIVEVVPNNAPTGLVCELVVEGETSGATMSFDMASGKPCVDSAGGEYSVVLDDITHANGVNATYGPQFSNVAKGMGGDFVPGENLRVYAWATRSDVLAKVATSATLVTNSLFASGTLAKHAYSCTVSSIRHLENLDAGISGFDPAGLGVDATASDFPTGKPEVAASQTVDLTWNDDLTRNEFLAGVDAGKGTGSFVYPANASADKPYYNGYVPVTPGYQLSYNGKGHMVSGVAVDPDDNVEHAGLFGTLGVSGTSVKNLELVDFSVAANSTGTAGAVAGRAGASTANALAGGAGASAANHVCLANILVRGKDGTVEGGSAGGLVGSTFVSGPESELVVDSCAASLRVRATGGSGAAGGLVGAVADDCPLRVNNSYSGGHTTDGKYDPKEPNVVSDQGTAGGLVGEATGVLAAKWCYSTCSVQGAKDVGGLVGSIAQGTVEDSYATGLVQRVGTAVGRLGALIGTLSNPAMQQGNSWYGAAQLEQVNPIGSDAEAAVDRIDASAKALEDFASSKELHAAVPYDNSLGNRYPLQTVVDLNTSLAGEKDGEDVGGEGEDNITPLSSGALSFLAVSERDDQADQVLPPATLSASQKHLEIHYGDWPSGIVATNEAVQTSSSAAGDDDE